jgi:hypothetical protein
LELTHKPGEENLCNSHSVPVYIHCGTHCDIVADFQHDIAVWFHFCKPNQAPYGNFAWFQHDTVDDSPFCTLVDLPLNTDFEIHYGKHYRSRYGNSEPDCMIYVEQFGRLDLAEFL